MKEVRKIMGMPCIVEIVDKGATAESPSIVFDYFNYIDEKFSVYKEGSEISRINRGEWPEEKWSKDMKTVFELSEKTKKETNGYFDIRRADGTFDPSGIVKGWAIFNAANLLAKAGFKNFYVDAGGDIEARGFNNERTKWIVGIQNPFNPKEIVKKVYLSDAGIATSGSYVRGDHIYNPHDRSRTLNEVVSLTVIGENVYEADRFATATFAMGRSGIEFIEKLSGFEGYQIDKDGMATETSGFEKYTETSS